MLSHFGLAPYSVIRRVVCYSVILLLVGAVRTEAVSDCSSCRSLRESRSTAAQGEKRFRDLLTANQKFLDGPGGKDASKAIKVRSNILVLLLKIDTSKNEVLDFDNQIKTKCGGCP